MQSMSRGPDGTRDRCFRPHGGLWRRLLAGAGGPPAYAPRSGSGPAVLAARMREQAVLKQLTANAEQLVPLLVAFGPRHDEVATVLVAPFRGLLDAGSVGSGLAQ